MPNTSNIALPLMAAAQSQKHVTHNDALLVLDALVQLSVLNTTLTAPPGSPVDGDRYIIGSGATGAWAGKDLNVTYLSSGVWIFLVPKTGWTAYNLAANTLLTWNGTIWVNFATASGLASLANITQTFLGQSTFSNANLTFGNSIATGTINLGTGATVSGSTKTMLFGTGGLSGSTTNITIGHQTAGTAVNLTFRGFVINIGEATTSSTLSLANGVTASGQTATLNLGANGASGSTTNIIIGPFTAGALGTTTFYGPNLIFASSVTALNATSTNISALRLGLGGATADATNRLSLNTPAALFNNAGTSVNLVLNKNAIANDASFTFQTGFSARALVGLLASDDFIFKVTPNGSTYFSGIRTFRNLHGRVAVKDSARRSKADWVVQGGGVSSTNLGLAGVVSGTITAVAPSASNLFTQSPRIKYVSAAVVGSAAGQNGGSLNYWRGNAADMGGFYVRILAGIEVFQATSRMFLGLYSSIAAIPNVNPSTLLNMIGIGFDSGDTQMQLMTNDGTGAATKTALGAGFPTTSGQDLYELILSAEPNGSEVRYRVERLNGGNVAEGTITVDLPTNTSFMTPHIWYNNGTSAGACEIAFLHMYAENASMLGSRGLIDT
jgi:hypothetical protein